MILYDISILGQGIANQKSRTGVHRFSESLLIELLKQMGDQISLVALNQSSSILDFLLSQKFLNIYYPQIEYLLCCSYPPRKSSLKGFLKAANSSFSDLYVKTLSQHNNDFVYYSMQVMRMVFELQAHMWHKKDFQIGEGAIYHSPYYQPPDSLPLTTPRLLTIHDLISIKFSNFFKKKSIKRMQKCLSSLDINRDWIICVSENTKKDFLEYTDFPPEKVFVTHLGGSDKFYNVVDRVRINQSLKKYSIPLNQPYFLSVCTLEPRKNLKFLLRCFSDILHQNPNLDINLVLVGISGWKNHGIFQKIQENSLLRKHTILTGYVADCDLSAIYSGALGFIYPSFYEGFGLPPLEAMQCGTPVITSNTSSLPEVVGSAGIMIDPTDSDALCQSMLNLINDSSLRVKLSWKGLERAKQFSWQKCARETINVYKHILPHIN